MHRVGLVIVAAAGLTALSLAAIRSLDPFDDRPFHNEAWATADSQDRGPMARDACRHLPPGTLAADVRELLGEGTPVERDPRGAVDVYGSRLEHPDTWTYYLGGWSGLGPYNFDSAFLYVHFDADGRVVATEITGG